MNKSTKFDHNVALLLLVLYKIFFLCNENLFFCTEKLNDVYSWVVDKNSTLTVVNKVVQALELLLNEKVNR